MYFTYFIPVTTVVMHTSSGNWNDGSKDCLSGGRYPASFNSAENAIIPVDSSQRWAGIISFPAIKRMSLLIYTVYVYKYT